MGIRDDKGVQCGAMRKKKITHVCAHVPTPWGGRGSIFGGLEARVRLEDGGCITERQADLWLSPSHGCRDKRRPPTAAACIPSLCGTSRRCWCHRPFFTATRLNPSLNLCDSIPPPQSTAMYVSGATTAYQTDRRAESKPMLRLKDSRTTRSSSRSP